MIIIDDNGFFIAGTMFEAVDSFEIIKEALISKKICTKENLNDVLYRIDKKKLHYDKGKNHTDILIDELKRDLSTFIVVFGNSKLHETAIKNSIPIFHQDPTFITCLLDNEPLEVSISASLHPITFLT